VNGVRRVGTRLTIIIYPYARRVTRASTRGRFVIYARIRTLKTGSLLIRTCTYVSAGGQMFLNVRTYVSLLSVGLCWLLYVRTLCIYTYI